MGETKCDATFPNGNVMEYVSPHDFHYSPDQRFAVRTCIRTTHDSSCLNGGDVWDMINGIRLRTFPPVSWYQWYPNQPHTLAHLESYSRPLRLFLWDLATGEKEYPSVCPEWLKLDKNAAFDARDVVAFCGYSLSPIATPE
jgi:hypothetical protein